MDRADVHELVGVVDGVGPDCREREELASAIAASARLRAWLDGRDVQLASQLARVAPTAERAIAEAARTSPREAERVLERGRITEAVPALGQALVHGEVSGAHVDVVAKALRRLEPPQRLLLASEGAWLVGIASSSTPEELRRVLDAEVRELQGDGGAAQLERQRRATRLRHWLDDDGMWCLFGRFDPETGLVLHGRLAAAADTLFAEKVPEHAPSDPLERQDFLRAHALLALTQGRGGSLGRAEVLVVLDTTAAGASGAPEIDWGLPVELPGDVLRRWFDTAEVTAVVVRNGVVLHAPGTLDLGRTTRLANRAQRRALRALYRGCAIPGCSVRYELCKLHHVVWWRHGGATDLANLLPLCAKHHRAVHDLGWQLSLAADRRLTITYPDGTEEVGGRPGRGRSRRQPVRRDGVRAGAAPTPAPEVILRT